ncbi:F0F1 ATP synthase subunit B [Xylanibacter rodentium]|jgi:F-type H+-transporting ATPase subunit b|uniref:ATP synthase subunit b n=4 Tax=Xylanibacter rodentium TaxID=2736289 RepID=A0ABX2AVK5_9BACT|nr:F0F1 ATP synthase subunit B [Xylanibacter rodentium]NPE11066.1 F0F1 ATP synthase subunit B [Prevotella sp. PJ1A]NPE14355.1 F0F1 ATP synthase subunit B [Xylanibacter rodentium]NPE39952.1 F0F1 ATP synthase subunit B [Prevotella sp. PCJ2]
MELNLPAILTPDLGLLFWMAIAFLVVFGVLAKFGFPAIIKMVDERKQYIDDSLRKAHEANEKLANIQKEGESILQEARERQAQILKEATATRDAIVEKAQEKAREEGARLLSEAKAEIESEKQAAISDIRRQVATLSVEIAEKVLREKLSTDKAQMDLIDRMLDDVSSSDKR